MKPQGRSFVESFLAKQLYGYEFAKLAGQTKFCRFRFGFWIESTYTDDADYGEVYNKIILRHYIEINDNEPLPELDAWWEALELGRCIPDGQLEKKMVRL